MTGRPEMVMIPSARQQISNDQGQTTRGESAERPAIDRVTAAGFERDKADTFSKLARYKTSLERSLYEALHELQRLQAALVGRAVLPPVVMDVAVDTSE